MPTKQAITDLIVRQGMLPLYFNADETVSVEVLRAIYKAGIKAVEYTNRGEAALKNFKKLVEVRDSEMPGLMLGVGTIKNLQQAEDYMKANKGTAISVIGGGSGVGISALQDGTTDLAMSSRALKRLRGGSTRCEA